MKTKKFLKKTEGIVKKTQSATVAEIDQCGEDLCLVIFRKNFNHVLLCVIFMLLSFILYGKANKLSFVNLDYYINFLAVFVGFSFISAIVFFSLYIYNRKKHNPFTYESVSKSYKYHQFYDVLSFVGIVVMIMLWLVMFIATPIEVKGNSMEKNYYEKDKLLVWHLNYEVEKNDVVIVDVVDKYNFNDGTDFVIKRVVATGGDKIIYDKNTNIVSVNGIQVVDLDGGDNASDMDNTPYETLFKQMLTVEKTGQKFYDENYEAVIPDGYCIVLGDNRRVSMDSRSVGLISEEDILGKCFFRIYPFKSFGLVE